MLLVAAACEVALDLVAWQCAGTRACAAATPGWASSRRPAGRRLVERSPAAASPWPPLVPAALTGLLWYLSHRTWSAYESQRPLSRAAEPADETGTHRRSAGPASGTDAGWSPGCAPRTPPPAC